MAATGCPSAPAPASSACARRSSVTRHRPAPRVDSSLPARGLDLVVQRDAGAAPPDPGAAADLQARLEVRHPPSAVIPPGVSALCSANANALNGRSTSAPPAKSTGCGLVSRPWMIFGMPSAMLSMSSPINPCRSRSSSMASMPAATRSRRGVRLHQHIHQMKAASSEPSPRDQRRIEAVGVGASEAALPFDDVIEARRSPARPTRPPQRRPRPRARAWIRLAELHPSSRTAPARQRGRRCNSQRIGDPLRRVLAAEQQAPGPRRQRCRSRRRCRCSGSRA